MGTVAPTSSLAPEHVFLAELVLASLSHRKQCFGSQRLKGLGFLFVWGGVAGGFGASDLGLRVETSPKAQHPIPQTLTKDPKPRPKSQKPAPQMGVPVPQSISPEVDAFRHDRDLFYGRCTNVILPLCRHFPGFTA